MKSLLRSTPEAPSSRLATTTLPVLLVVLCAQLSVSAAEAECEDGGRPWPWIGVDVLQCPGGSCAAHERASMDIEPGSGSATVSLSDVASRPVFDFSTEPRLRSIAPDGPAAGSIDEGDTLVAVNGYLITSARGGQELATLPFDRPAALTLRRGDRLIEVELQPEARCRPPVTSSGSGVSGRSMSVARSGDSGGLARALGRGSIGLSLECDGCRFNLADERNPWSGKPRHRRVVRVASDGLAWQAGLRSHDVLIEVDGMDLRTREGNEALFRYLLGHDAEDRTARLRYRRNGEERITLLSIPGQPEAIRIRPLDSERIDRTQSRLSRLVSRLSRVFGRGGDGGTGAPDVAGISGMQGQSWGNGHLGMTLGWEPGFRWAVAPDGGFQWEIEDYPRIVEVESGGPAAAAGLQSGDRLTHVNGSDLLTAEGGKLLVLTNQRGARLELRFLRDAESRTTELVAR